MTKESQIDFSGPVAFYGLGLKRAVLTSLLVKSCQAPMVTLSVRSVWPRVRVTPRTSLVSFMELTDLYMFMKALAF